MSYNVFGYAAYVRKLAKPLNRIFYQSLPFLVSWPMLISLWKMFNLFPLPVLVTLKGNSRRFITIILFTKFMRVCKFNFSTPEELTFIQDVAVKTGIFFDRVYSGKAFKKTIEYVQENQIENPLFIHTGGVHSIRLDFK